jgi:hypothetical protein
MSSSQEKAYLYIINPGEAPVEALTILGITSTRYKSDDLYIGQFGSGAKHAIALLLRMGINPIIYCGLAKLEFFTTLTTVKDRDYRQVNYKISGKLGGKTVNRTEKLSFVLDFGEMEWTEAVMAFREFISNALDAALNANRGTDFKCPHAGVSIGTCDESMMRATAGFTKVFIPIGSRDFSYIKDINQYFLHFDKPTKLIDGFWSATTMQTKSEAGYRYSVLRRVLPRSRNESGKPRIYRKGVLVGTAHTDYSSVFNYNFGDELAIDESRNIRDFEAKDCAARELSQLSCDQLCEIFEYMLRDEKKWEHTFHWYNMKSSIQYMPEDVKKERIDAIKQGWELALERTGKSRESVIAATSADAEKMDAKGIPTVMIPDWAISEWVPLLNTAGVRSASTFITAIEKANEIKDSEPTEEVRESFKFCWELLIRKGIIAGEQAEFLPRIRCFVKTPEFGQQRLGFYQPLNHTIYIEDQISRGYSQQLFVTMLEEVVHAATKAQDFGRDFQDVVLRLVYYVLMEVTFDPSSGGYIHKLRQSTGGELHDHIRPENRL